MTFNVDKFEILRCSPTGSPRPVSYSVEGIEIKQKVVVKEIGLFKSKLYEFQSTH